MKKDGVTADGSNIMGIEPRALHILGPVLYLLALPFKELSY